MVKRIVLAVALICAGGASVGFAGSTPVDTYAIVASEAVMQDAEWKAATVDALQAKYPHARVYIWKQSPEEVREGLSKQMPSFTAFVVRPEEAGVKLTIDVSNVCRALDDDPYTDTFWGVITGYDAPAARKVAEAKPIAVRRALDCANCDLTAFDKAWRYTEDHRGTMLYWEKGKTDSVEKMPCDTDNTQGVLERLQKDRVQFLATSGHATQHDWQMGYCGPNMAMVHREGKLYAIDTKKQIHPAGSDEAKVYIASGNCLIGDVDKTDCMALSWMRDGGVRQFVGYTVTTWFGAQGWGTLGLFVGASGSCTASEAFHFTNLGIVDWLEHQPIDDLRSYRLKEIQRVNFPNTPGMQRYLAELKQKGETGEAIRKKAQELSGNLHDRDTVCFYGDPALDARIADGRFKVLPPTFEKGELTLAVTVCEGAKDGALWLRLPGSWRYDAKQLEASPELGRADVVLDNALRFPEVKAETAIGKTLRVKLRNAKRKGAQP